MVSPDVSERTTIIHQTVEATRRYWSPLRAVVDPGFRQRHHRWVHDRRVEAWQRTELTQDELNYRLNVVQRIVGDMFKYWQKLDSHPKVSALLRTVPLGGSKESRSYIATAIRDLKAEDGWLAYEYVLAEGRTVFRPSETLTFFAPSGSTPLTPALDDTRIATVPIDLNARSLSEYHHYRRVEIRISEALAMMQVLTLAGIFLETSDKLNCIRRSEYITLQQR